MGILEWMKSRTDIPDELVRLLKTAIPRNVGWLHTLGSLFLLYLVIQIVTGTLLAFYYSPSPDHAYDSVRYIQEELFLGGFVFALHKHGAAFCFCVALLHGLRGFLAGEYKNPRELLWMSGVGVFILLFASHFTGALLPFDQNSYWGTLVRLDIVKSQPIVGPVILDVLTDGTGEIGIVTLTRFFVLHVWVLPLALLAVVGIHIKILHKTSWAPPVDGSAEPTRPFFPAQLYKDLIVSVLGVLVLFAVASWAPNDDTGPAPGDESFEPYPDWYHAPLYQLLRVAPSKLLGGVVIPGLVFGFLFVLPFIDRGPDRQISRRKGVVGFGLALLAATFVLGAWGLHTISKIEPIVQEAEGESAVERGLIVYEDYDCESCHTIGGEGEHNGPQMDYVGRRFTSEWLYDMMKDPEKEFPGTEMPPFDGTEQELLDLVQYMKSLK